MSNSEASVHGECGRATIPTEPISSLIHQAFARSREIGVKQKETTITRCKIFGGLTDALTDRSANSLLLGSPFRGSAQHTPVL